MTKKQGSTFWDWARQEVDGCGCVFILVGAGILTLAITEMILKYLAWK